MGCCESAPTAPEVIIPDPGEQEACTFSIIKSAGMMSSGSFLAYQEAPPWGVCVLGDGTIAVT